MLCITESYSVRDHDQITNIKLLFSMKYAVSDALTERIKKTYFAQKSQIKCLLKTAIAIYTNIF